MLYFRTPLDFLFWYCTLTSICALFGLAGIFSAQPKLVIVFFGYNLCQTVLSFNLFVDVLAGELAGRQVRLCLLRGWQASTGERAHAVTSMHRPGYFQRLLGWQLALPRSCRQAKLFMLPQTQQTRASGTWARRRT